jgi:hypothetical protein
VIEAALIDDIRATERETLPAAGVLAAAKE